MPIPINPRREQPSSYVVQDRSNQDERTRISIQDQMLTIAMGGTLSEQPDAAALQRVIDVGCGTAGWLIEVAKTYPHMALLVGVDISGTILEYAQAQAQAQEHQVAHRIEFRAMDALRRLEFPDDLFDLVNQRLGSSFLRAWDWMRILQEYKRVVRPGGIVRITESDMVKESSSPALLRFNDIVFRALDEAGHFLGHQPDGVTSELVNLLKQQGFRNIQTRVHRVEYRTGTPQGERYFEDTRYATRTLLPFLQKWTQVPEDYDSLCQQMFNEMQQPDFFSIWQLLTVWAVK
jgi:ubiquinone/menaquinone biosynthesis C-methylase UbiE